MSFSGSHERHRHCVTREKNSFPFVLGRAAESPTRRFRPSVSKIISQPRTLGGRRPVDRASGAALRLIDLTHVRVYSRANDDFFFCFLRSNDGTKTGVCLLSVLFRSLRLTKTVLKPKQRPCKRSFRVSGGLLVSEFFQSEKQRSLDDQRRRSDGLR